MTLGRRSRSGPLLRPPSVQGTPETVGTGRTETDPSRLGWDGRGKRSDSVLGKFATRWVVPGPW